MNDIEALIIECPEIWFKDEPVLFQEHVDGHETIAFPPPHIPQF
jgi:hypothetical protein